ncbi:MAG: hypothetical protein JWO45_447, partial [Spartobacteria bacterium]|nr:hypothetical protein [Spartobacteria bacterium]
MLADAVGGGLEMVAAAFLLPRKVGSGRSLNSHGAQDNREWRLSYGMQSPLPLTHRRKFVSPAASAGKFGGGETFPQDCEAGASGIVPTDLATVTAKNSSDSVAAA